MQLQHMVSLQPTQTGYMDRLLDQVYMQAFIYKYIDILFMYSFYLCLMFCSIAVLSWLYCTPTL